MNCKVILQKITTSLDREVISIHTSTIQCYLNKKYTNLGISGIQYKMEEVYVSFMACLIQARLYQDII